MTPDQQFWWDWGVQLLTGGATVAAVLVALFGKWLQYKLAPPKLRISLLSEDGEKTDVGLVAPPTEGFPQQFMPQIITKARWYLVRVENQRRWAEVNGVQVFLLRIEEPDPSGQFRAVWLGAIPLNWRHGQHLDTGATRVVGYPAEADLVCLYKRGALSEDPFVKLQLVILPSPIEKWAIRGNHCRFRVVLQARGKEADSNTLTIHIGWNGDWADATERARLSMAVREVRSPLSVAA